jgi:transcriptional regulator with XRE-family HTH domain
MPRGMPAGLQPPLTGKNKAVQKQRVVAVTANRRAPNPVDVHVGSRVRLRRVLLGMSQEKLADQLGLTFQQVQKYEKGTNRISASRLQQISRILEVPISYFYDELPGDLPSEGFLDAPAPDFVVDFLSNAESLQLMKAFVRIADGRVRRKVVDLVRAIAGEDGDIA